MYDEDELDVWQTVSIYNENGAPISNLLRTELVEAPSHENELDEDIKVQEEQQHTVGSVKRIQSDLEEDIREAALLTKT